MGGQKGPDVVRTRDFFSTVGFATLNNKVDPLAGNNNTSLNSASRRIILAANYNYNLRITYVLVHYSPIVYNHNRGVFSSQ